MESQLRVESKVKNNDVKAMIGFLLIFYLVWTIKELWLIDYIYSFGEIISPLLEALVKGFVWIVPTWLYIKLLSIDDYLNGFLMAGLAEEIVFRGLILQEINKKMAFWKANIITALLFLVIHYQFGFTMMDSMISL